MPPVVDPQRCSLCGVCADVCPGDILHADEDVSRLVRYPAECQHCDICRIECPEQAIRIVFPWHMLQQPARLPTRS
jgi:adenylylsulfate reductase, subunit B